MTRRPPRTSGRSAATADVGFTLVELLVVIGIVVLLVAIVLPTVGKARIVAQSARTQADMVAIAGAIERYYNDHRAYPGVISNAAITAGYTAPGITSGRELTMTENMVLTLCGGFVYNEADPAKPKVDVRDIGKGPMNLSASVLKRTRRAPYIEAGPGNLFPAAYDVNNPASGVVNGPTNPLESPGQPAERPGESKACDSNVPEFVDAYAQPRPIVYMRAVVGGKVLPDPPPGQPPARDYFKDDALQYDLQHFTKAYRREGAVVTPGNINRGDFKGDFVFTTNENDTTEFQYAFDFFKHPRIANSPRGKDKYILMSAGPDRRFGTRDDIATDD